MFIFTHFFTFTQKDGASSLLKFLPKSNLLCVDRILCRWYCDVHNANDGSLLEFTNELCSYDVRALSNSSLVVSMFAL